MAIEEDQTKRTLVLKGIGVSPGIVIGKAFIFDQFDPQITFYRLQDDALVSKEIDRLENALRESEKQLQEIKHKLQDMGGEEPSYIIDVHIMILKDKMFLNHTLDHIRDMRVNAEWALRMTVEKYKKLFDKVEDDYLRGRFSDIQYVGQLVIRNLSGGKREVIADINKGVVVIATDLSPADTAQMMIHKVLGFATDMGGRTSHTAIVAQSIEIPAVVGLEYITKVVRTNDDVIIDGATGLVIVHPDPEILNRYV